MTDQTNIAKGSCLCGEVRYQVTGNLGLFQYCHCSRCRKLSGSVHSANLLVAPNQFSWLAGESSVGRYELEDTKHFATSFCKKCGSTMPWLTQSGKAVVVGAGTLDEHPGIEPRTNNYFASRASWYVSAEDLPKFDELPTK